MGGKTRSTGVDFATARPPASSSTLTLLRRAPCSAFCGPRLGHLPHPPGAMDDPLVPDVQSAPGQGSAKVAIDPVRPLPTSTLKSRQSISSACEACKKKKSRVIVIVLSVLKLP